MRPAAAGAAALATAASLASCGPPMGTGDLMARSLGEQPVLLAAEYVTAYYGRLRGPETSFYLSSVPVEQILEGRIRDGLIVHIDLLWVPKAGATPMDDSATNASIHYVVIADGEVGLYGGAGFARPRGEAGDPTLGLALRDASLTLLASSEGFVDLLSPARLSGMLTAEHSEQRTLQIGRAVSQIVTNALGRSRFVLGAAPGAPAS